VVAFPLLVDDKAIGVCIVVINRLYDELPEYEKDSLQSITGVISVALDKSILYEKLIDTNAELAEKNKRLEELDQMKTEFVSIASHQLRAPLTAIKGYTSLILEGSYGAVPESLTEAMDRIFESSKFMASAIDDFLNITRIELGKMKYEFSIFDLNALAEQTYQEFMPLAEKKHLELHFESGGNVMVEADENKTKQVLNNLLDNAIKYTPEGTVSIAVANDASTKKVAVTISDTGIGVSKEDQSKLFAKFSRASNVGAAHVQGTGLGLFVAKEMTHAMHGEITLQSEGVGKGSTTIFSLPTH
jgi:signal transduction histidine kinase